MSKEDIQRVQDILDAKIAVDGVGKGSHTSLGIRNVNERIKLLYGEEYGLTIAPIGEEETASTITIPSEIKANPEKGKLLKKLMDKAVQ